MARVQVWVELTDDEFHAYELEAEREGRNVDSLIEQTVRVLWEEWNASRRRAPITPFSRHSPSPGPLPDSRQR